MRIIATHRLMAAAAIALIGAIMGHWITASSNASTTAAAVASGRCGSMVCTSHTWLWIPAMRRAR